MLSIPSHLDAFQLQLTPLNSKERVAVYDQQRAFRAERAETIAEEKAKEAAELSGGFCIPGVISIAEGTANVKGGGARKKKGSKDSSGDVVSASILDGQHRVGALDILLARGVLKPTDAILTEVFPNVDDVRAAALFTEINAATPIRFMDLPGVVEPDAKWALEGAAAKLRDAYPAMFSPSVRCKVRSIQKFFTHRLVSTFDRVSFQLTGELFLYGTTFSCESRVTRARRRRKRSAPSRRAATASATRRRRGG